MRSRRGSSALLALGELVTDQLPSTPSRTVPVQFGDAPGRGCALSAAAIGASGGALVAGAIAGVVGAVIGTLGGRAVRGRLAAAFGNDRPAALIEDVVAIGGALLDRGDAAMKSFDAIIIGAGQAGPSLAGRLTRPGMTVAFVERKLFGGTCVNTGCMPTKTLVASAYAAHLAGARRDFGVVLDRASADRHEGGQGTRRRRVGQLPRRRREQAAQHGRLHGLPRPRAVRVGDDRPRRRRAAHGAAHLHQRRWTRASFPTCPASDRVPS